jgi:hypothetical protein
MRTTFECGDHGALVSYLYGECDPDERAAIGAHVALCAACAAELAALESTRVQLSSWSPPETDLGFAISRPQGPDPRPQAGADARGLGPGAWFARPLPAWAQLAAAVVIFAAGLALGIARPSMIPQGALSFVDGRGTIPPSPASAVAARPSAPVAAAARGESVTGATLDALEERLRGEIAELRASGAPPVAAPASASVEGQLLARVRALIDESEQRQQRELALRTAQIVRDFDSQRRVDLEQIQRNFGQIEGLAGAEVREQRQMLNYLMRVSQPQ